LVLGKRAEGAQRKLEAKGREKERSSGSNITDKSLCAASCFGA